MPHETHLTVEETVILAIIWIILAGAGSMPAPIVIAQIAIRETLAAYFGDLLKWVGIMLAAAVVIAVAIPVPAAAAEKRASVIAPSVASANLDRDITEAFLHVTGKSAKPIPVWLLDLAARIYTAYKTYRNGQKVEEAARIAQAALAEAAQVRAEIEAGRVLTEHEQRITHTRLKAQAASIEGLDRRVTGLERRTERLERKTDLVTRIVTRRGCPTLHAWDRKLGRCTLR